MGVRSLVDAVRSSTPDPEPETADVSKEELFMMLKNDRRQLAVRHLHDDVESDESVTCREVSKYIARCEHGVERCSSNEYKRVYVSMYQSHLPKLVDAGLAEEVGQGEYRPGPNLEAAAEILEVAEAVAGGDA